MSVREVERADFSSLVGLLNEPNMPSGGGRTVRRILDLARLRPGGKILEVGCNTGFSTIEFASWVDGTVTGVDINPLSLELARAKASANGVENVNFDLADATAMPYPDGAFDLVFCSNVTSFILDKDAALREYYRVLGRRGCFAAAPIYYVDKPPKALVDEVAEAIGVPLPVTDQSYWHSLFSNPRSTLLEVETHAYRRQTAGRIAAYVHAVLSRGVGADVPPDVLAAAGARLGYFYDLFDRNLQYARYDVLLYRCEHPNPEQVLHETERVNDA